MLVQELFATMRLNVDSAGFKAARGALDSIGGYMKQVVGNYAGLFAVDQVVQFTRETFAALPAIGDVARTAGVATDALQELRFAFNNSGAEEGELDNALIRLNKNIAEAADGNKELASSFSKMGIKIKDSEGKLRSADAVFLDLADGIAAIDSPAKQAERAMTFLGSVGDNLVQGLAQGSEGISELRKEAKRLGVVLDNELIEAAGSADDSINNLSALLKANFMATVAAAAPLVEEIVKVLIEFFVIVRKGIKWLAKYSDLIKKLAVFIGSILLVQMTKYIALQTIMIAKTLAQVYGNSLLAGSFALVQGAINLATLSLRGLLVAFTKFIAPLAVAGVAFLVFEDLWASLSGGIGLFSIMQGKWSEFGDSWFASINPDDAWWIVALKIGIGYVAKFIGLFDDGIAYIGNKLMDFGETLMSIWEFASDLFSGNISNNYDFVSMKKGLRDFMNKPVAQGVVAGGTRGEEFDFIPQSIPANSTSTSKNATVNTGGITVNVNGPVNGMNGQSLANQIGQSIEQSQMSISRAALDNLASP